MENKIKGYISISDFNNIENLNRYGVPVEVFYEKESAKDAMPKGTRIVECEIILTTPNESTSQ